MILDHHNNCLPDAWAIAEPILDLAQLNPEASELDLVVQSAQELNHALR